MIKTISNINQHLEWIDTYIYDECFSSPFCDMDRIISSADKNDHVILGSYNNDELTGIFCLIVLDDEKTIETLYMYSRDREAYDDFIKYLSVTYQGYEVWFVFNPKNYILKDILLNMDAYFYSEQRFMEYKGKPLSDVENIIPYSDIYKDEYIRIHVNDGYWNGEKVVERMDDFNVFLCIKENHLVGYIDISKGTDLVEIMDLYIHPEYRNQGIGRSLLTKAISFVGNKRLILTVDIDNDVANHLYKNISFKEIALNNCLTAKYTFSDKKDTLK